jgi:hypothetical protein
MIIAKKVLHLFLVTNVLYYWSIIFVMDLYVK